MDSVHCTQGSRLHLVLGCIRRLGGSACEEWQEEQVPTLLRTVPRRPAMRVGCLSIRTAAKQQLNDCGMPPLAGGAQCSCHCCRVG
mmetsp:Transcript_16866/g.40266  ORF Transcript_16866/g.40266 Transcript_16866/m.40266 type:complete len:86 (+) Transcript_16866:268-525(+)